QTFDTVYTAIQANDIPAVSACLTDAGKNEFFEGNAPSSGQDFARIVSALAARQPRSYVLNSFRFTSDPVHPKIRVVYSYSVTVNGNDSRIADAITLVLTDTPVGWKIESWLDG
ncbi:MAG: hypothetical protein QOE81_344, partial [Verrucomicrobiota bacterium]